MTTWPKIEFPEPLALIIDNDSDNDFLSSVELDLSSKEEISVVVFDEQMSGMNELDIRAALDAPFAGIVYLAQLVK
jgi:copper(I)-binding protein